MEQKETSKNDRSPNCPQIELERILEIAKTLRDNMGKSPFTSELAARAMGYNSLHGAVRMQLAALNKYGLFEKVGADQMRISELAMKALHPIDAGARAEALKTMALNPVVFREIFENYHESSEEVLTNRLIHKGFTPEGARKVASTYKANSAFANLEGFSNAMIVQTTDIIDKTPRNYPPVLASASEAFFKQPSTVQRKDLLAEYKLPLDMDNEVELRFLGKELTADSFDALTDFIEVIKKRFKRAKSSEAQSE